MRISTKPTPLTLGLGIIGATPDELADDTKAGVLCLVRDERPLSSGPAKPAWMDCLMSGSSPTPVLVWCCVLRGSALYLLFNALNSTVRPLLETCRREHAFCLANASSGQACVETITGDMFQNVWASTMGKPAPDERQWFLHAKSLAPLLPNVCAISLPRIARLEDHRAWVMMCPSQFSEVSGVVLED